MDYSGGIPCTPLKLRCVACTPLINLTGINASSIGATNLAFSDLDKNWHIESLLFHNPLVNF
jgi:hypothetical protein